MRLPLLAVVQLPPRSVGLGQRLSTASAPIPNEPTFTIAIGFLFYSFFRFPHYSLVLFSVNSVRNIRINIEYLHWAESQNESLLSFIPLTRSHDRV